MIQDLYITPSGGTQLQILGGSNGISVNKPIEGLEAAERRVRSYEKEGEDGIRVTSMLYGGRVIGMSGSITSASSILHEQTRSSLSVATKIVREENGFPSLTLFEYTTLSGEQRMFMGAIKTFRMPVAENTYSKFEMVVLIEKSGIQDANQVIESGIISPAGGGFILPVILPIVFASDTGGSVDIDNPGTAPVYPTLTIDGSATNPYIRNATTGKSFQLTGTSVVGDQVVIDMEHHTVTRNGLSIITEKTDISEWWQMEPGDNTIEYSTGSASDTGQLTVSFYPEYLEGV